MSSKKRKKKRKASTAASVDVSARWRVWIAENLLRGATGDMIVEGLVSQGVPAKLAERALAETIREPSYAAARETALELRQLKQMVHLQRDLSRHTSIVERRRDLSVEDFYRSYYAMNTPVILEGFFDDWPARAWTPARLAELLGDTEVAITDGREADPDYDMRAAEHTRPTAMRELVDRVLAVDGESNDFYLVANNRNLERDTLSLLFDEMRFGETMLSEEKRVGGSALWFGPAGTVTPLHHDTSNILFLQVYGRKRYRMYSPFEMDLLRDARSMYAGFSPEDDPERADRCGERSFVLDPGDTLFIPVGWWHHVRALDVAISLAFTCFTKRNAYDWYRPRSARLGHKTPPRK